MSNDRAAARESKDERDTQWTGVAFDFATLTVPEAQINHDACHKTFEISHKTTVTPPPRCHSPKNSSHLSKSYQLIKWDANETHNEVFADPQWRDTHLLRAHLRVTCCLPNPAASKIAEVENTSRNSSMVELQSVGPTSASSVGRELAAVAVTSAAHRRLDRSEILPSSSQQ